MYRILYADFLGHNVHHNLPTFLTIRCWKI